MSFAFFGILLFPVQRGYVSARVLDESSLILWIITVILERVRHEIFQLLTTVALIDNFCFECFQMCSAQFGIKFILCIFLQEFNQCDFDKRVNVFILFVIDLRQCVNRCKNKFQFQFLFFQQIVNSAN